MELVDKKVVLNAINVLSFVGYLNADDIRNYVEWLKPVTVVRCEECKHKPFGRQFPDGECPYYHCDDGYSEFPSDDFFCAKGEREELH